MNLNINEILCKDAAKQMEVLNFKYVKSNLIFDYET